MFRAIRCLIQKLCDPQVEIVGDKDAAIASYCEMLADQRQRIKSKKNELSRLSNDIADLEKHCQGAQLMAQEIVTRKKKEIEAKLSRGDITQSEAESELQTIENDEEFNYCWDHYTRNKEAIETKKQRIPVLTQEIKDLESKIVYHEQMLTVLGGIEPASEEVRKATNLTIIEKIGDE
ncbi:MAG: hypothetical protein PHS86_11420 [Syntrophaceae bacterium]|nr:hypothetical protein [Syntrophaceae bacterium]